MGQHDLPASRAALRSLIEATFHADDATPPRGADGAIGLEVEFFPVTRNGARLSLVDLTHLLDDLAGVQREGARPVGVGGLPAPRGEEVHPHGPGHMPVWHTASGGRLLPEPGGQVEYAGPPRTGVRAAIADLNETVQALAAHAGSHGVALLSAGLDPLGNHVEQQLTGTRYPAMHAYFGRRSPHGHLMMTGTASIQVNLDLGSGETAAQRWRVAQLVAPLATATFANSPVPGAISGRAVVWGALDPTRTGIPSAFVASDLDTENTNPVDVLLDAALCADVVLVRRNDRGSTGEPGFTFERWLEEGHEVHGRPSMADAANHLTTLFHEVRVRPGDHGGVLEIRSVDALPAAWRSVPATLYAGLLYDEECRNVAQRVMGPHQRSLPELLDRSSRLGLWDPQLCAMAVEVWTTAARAARRLGSATVSPSEVAVAEQFLDTFTLRGRAPSDVLRDAQASGPAAVMDACAEPLLLTGGSR
ncbi:glutamate-cysteine ligase family protein [Euzebya tangerina]|uniref:glutamate-cysteine ligase family protein n=1 Tax=Euzebya tangerina TaxID=591198 RepID=UPI0013C36133|nr:glutamate-cysteine ligase family protein [Euzebya tangerina]